MKKTYPGCLGFQGMTNYPVLWLKSTIYKDPGSPLNNQASMESTSFFFFAAHVENDQEKLKCWLQHDVNSDEQCTKPLLPSIESWWVDP